MKSGELLRLLQRDGWFEVRQTGSHIDYATSFKGIVVFPTHGSKEVGKGLERKIKKDAGL